MLQPKLETAFQIIRFLEGLSYFIDRVTITEVYYGGFSFKVKVPLWYKITLGWKLRKIIQEKLNERMYSSLSFKFKIYSQELF